MAAGTSYMTLRLSNGQTLSVLISTSAAIGTIPTVNMEGTALSTDPTDFSVKSPCKIVDQVNTVGTAGSVSAGICEVYNVTKSVRTGRQLENATAKYAATVANRVVPNIGFLPGNTYRLLQTVAQVSA